MPKINNCKYVLRHKPTGLYAGRNSGKISYRAAESNQLDNFLTPHINDARVFTNKSTAGNSAIFQYSKLAGFDVFEKVPVTLVIMNQ